MHDLQLDRSTDEPAQQVRELGQRVGDVEHLGLQGLLAREGEELAHEVRRAVGVLPDLHDIGKRRIARLVAQQQQVAEADHRGQQVVEVVRDAAGKLADGLHLLRLGELLLEPALLADVEEMQNRGAVDPRRFVERAREGGDDALLAVRSDQPHVDVLGGPFACALAARRDG